jgi:hypothetical protein
MKYMSKASSSTYSGVRLWSADRQLKNYIVADDLKEKFDDGHTWETYEVGACTENYKNEMEYFAWWDISCLKFKKIYDDGIACLGLVPGVYSDAVPF